MARVTRYAAPVVALLLVAGCAGRQKQRTEVAQTPQQRSQQALERASEAQKRANQQADKAAQARQDVQNKQRELQQAQERARQEQAKAEEMQRAANDQTQQATREAQQAQQQATQALSQQTKAVEQGVMTLRGQVSQASGDQLVLQGSGGESMTFRVTNQTDIRIDGRQANAAEIAPGENALVAYDVGGTEPTARSVQIVTGRPALTGSGSSSDATQPSNTALPPPATTTSPSSAPAPQDPNTSSR